MFELPDLPYAYDALMPVISDDTLHFHHDKHHAAYVKTTNELLQQAGRAAGSLEEVVAQAHRAGEKKLFNNAAQAWNHAFFWECMSAETQDPTGDLDEAVRKAFGDVAKLKEAFVTEGAGHFASGWVWLVADRSGAVKVISTHDAADTLTEEGTTPLLVCDLWEHAYYLDYQNDRKGFLGKWFDALPNWRFAGQQFDARDRGGAYRFPEPSRSRVGA
ncbi:MAG TPA: superoxide dismutase [Caulobacteraceae bacterium]|jgi:Fe-Mn family superoxide dismutase|nr:superoxide dismutase [Caulobacteraceae bacterium]